MEFQKIANLFGATFYDKDLPRFVTENGLKCMINQKKITNKEIRTKTPMLRLELCDFSDPYIVVKGNVTVTEPINAKKKKVLRLETMRHLSTAFQKSMTNKLAMQKI